MRQRLELNASPWLGKLPISSISTHMLVENLQRIIKRGARETTHHVAQIYKQIFEFAEAAGITPPNQIGNLSHTPSPRHEETTGRCPTTPYSALYAAWTSAATK
ncbi:hypothetical protein [Pseudomonas sp. S5D5]|uniref:phage integrase central domain-containing protein n=1 Tax=Pseudomonas sp. S5D5 TaxID=2083056 RepID=UPI003531C17A